MRSLRSLRFLAGCVCLLTLLSGCVTPRPSVPGAPVVLEELHQWDARGRIGISGPEGGGSGTFDWRQRGDEANVQIRGPVGIGSVRLEVRGDADRPELQLQTGNGVTLQSDAAWDELEARLGASLPAGHLRYWLLGLAAPGAHEWVRNESGEETLEQQGWRIDYQRYSNEFGARLPVRMRATSGDARVRIIIDRWQLGR